MTMIAGMEGIDMTQHQHELLTLINDHTKHEDNDTQRPLTCYWYPSHLYSTTLKREVLAFGSGTASSLRSMERRGWIRPHRKISDYAYSITDIGRIALQTYNESQAL